MTCRNSTIATEAAVAVVGSCYSIWAGFVAQLSYNAERTYRRFLLRLSFGIYSFCITTRTEAHDVQYIFNAYYLVYYLYVRQFT